MGEASKRKWLQRMDRMAATTDTTHEKKSAALAWWGFFVSLTFGLIVQWWDPAPILRWVLLSMAFGGCLTSIIGWAVTWSDTSLGVKSYVVIFVSSSVAAAIFIGRPRPDRIEERQDLPHRGNEVIRAGKNSGRVA